MEDEIIKCTREAILAREKIEYTIIYECIMQALKTADSLSKNGYNGMLDLMREADRSDIKKAIEELEVKDGMISKKEVMKILEIKETRYGL